MCESAPPTAQPAGDPCDLQAFASRSRRATRSMRITYAPTHIPNRRPLRAGRQPKHRHGGTGARKHQAIFEDDGLAVSPSEPHETL